jgi:FkbM family methyltransferase
MTIMNRRYFLGGIASGLVGGAAVTKAMDRFRNASEDESNIADALSRSNASYSQQGEDVIIRNIFEAIKAFNPSYIDIGAFDPIIGSNTFLFYLHGSKGVLVEPNPAKCRRLRAVRTKDRVLNIGIGVTNQKEADYYVLEGDGQFNTFSKEDADKRSQISGKQMIKDVMKMPLRTINEVLQENFSSAPDLFSIDIEGMDFDVLKSLNFMRFRPKIICIETTDTQGRIKKDIVAFLESKQYTVRGSTFVNSIFLDNAFFGPA